MSQDEIAKPGSSPPPALELVGLTKTFKGVTAVDAVDLTVKTGEFLTLLGPSGSGKTTTLRMIAGFAEPTAGAIYAHGTEIGHLPPHKRNVGIVFQNYALFPHKTAAENVAFPLAMRKRPKGEIAERVRDALALVHLDGFGDRYPRELSGGQQQRVALARSFVYEPQILLMDEPLGALDKKLRDALQLEIVRISRQIGATVIYVTHDQEEALTMSDRVAIFDSGRIEQLGRPEDLYERPISHFVADFVGESTILPGKVARGRSGHYEFMRGEDRWLVEGAELEPSSAVALMIRPEHLQFSVDSSPSTGANRVRGRVEAVTYAGSSRRYSIALADGVEIVARRQAAGGRPIEVGDDVDLWWEVPRGRLIRH